MRQFKMKVYITATFILATLATHVVAQVNIDGECDPSGANATLQCHEDVHLICMPLWNMFSDGTCRCQSGTYWHAAGFGRCRVGANNPCDPTEGSTGPQCTPNAACTPGDEEGSGACQCGEGFYAEATGGLCVVGHGVRCGDASFQIAQCDSTKGLTCGGPDNDNRICTCSGSQIWSSSRSKCVSTVETSSSCTVNDDCVDNAICSRNDVGFARCRCAPGFSKNDANTCSLTMGATCDPASPVLQCNHVEMLECSAGNNTCVCADSRVAAPVSGGVACLGVAGHECAVHGDCATGALCHSGLKQCFCAQNLDMIQLVDRKCGRLGRDGYCRLSGFQDCPASEYLQCNPIPGAPYGRCECPSGMETDQNGRCLRLAGAPCSTGNQNCVPNAACLQGSCTCLPGFSPTSTGRCLRSNTQTCDLTSPDNQCNGEDGLECVGNTCTCRTGLEWSPTQRRCVALVAGSCLPAANFCTENAQCSALGFCECAEGYSQRSPEDRHCAPSHGTECHPETAPCSQHQFLTCSLALIPMRCACEFPLHQTWDPARGSCVSVLGGRCGALEEHPGREQLCVDTAVCKLDANLLPKCVCDEENGWEPDGNGKCQLKEEDPAMTTSTTTTTTTAPPPTTPEDEDNGAPIAGTSGLIFAISAIILLNTM